MSNIVNNIFWKWDAAIPKEVCKASLEAIDWATSEMASVNTGAQVIDPSIRRTDVVWQHFMQPLGCIARAYMQSANEDAGWNFELRRQENTQIGRYKSSDEGFYDWHMDAAAPKEGIQRKLSCVVLLNDPSEFEGGALEFKIREGENVLTAQGDVIVFPSYMEHRVTPVTKGVRYTSVAWASGPSFR